MRLSVIFVFLSAFGCSRFDEEKGRVIASVGDSYLYQSDLEGLRPNKPTLSDSSNITERYIDAWIKRKLMLKAAKKLVMNEKELERRLEDYRYKLITYEYEKQIINQQLDTLVTPSQIEAYYNSNKESFVLKTDILRASMLKLAKVAPKMTQIKRMMREGTNNAEILNYALSHADFYHLTDTVWIDANELLASTPFMNDLRNRTQMLRSNRYFEAFDNDFVYMLRVEEYKLSDQTSPLDYVQPQIKAIILNQRKNQIRAKLQEEIFRNSKEGIDYMVYKN